MCVFLFVHSFALHWNELCETSTTTTTTASITMWNILFFFSFIHCSLTLIVSVLLQYACATNNSFFSNVKFFFVFFFKPEPRVRNERECWLKSFIFLLIWNNIYSWEFIVKRKKKETQKKMNSELTVTWKWIEMFRWL